MGTFRKTVTKKQLSANRENAKKSTGPQDPAMKAKVSRNAIRHGLTGEFIVLACESQQEFDDFFNALVEDEKPVGAAELELVRKIAEYSWLRARATRLHEGSFSVLPRTEEQEAKYQWSITFSPHLDKIIRYQAHYERCYAKASAELLKRRKERQIAENGIASQKHAAVEEARRETQQNQRDELHKIKHATAEINREYAQTRKVTADIRREHAQIKLLKELDVPALQEFHKMAA